MRRVLVGLFLLSLVLTACGTKPNQTVNHSHPPKIGGTPKPSEPKSVVVPLSKKDHDPTVVIKPTTTVTNDEYMDGDQGTVTVSAKTASKHPDTNQHWLSAKVKLKSGGTAACQENRSTVWSDFAVYEDISMPCDKKLKLSDVASVVIVP